MNKAELKFW